MPVAARPRVKFVQFNLSFFLLCSGQYSLLKYGTNDKDSVTISVAENTLDGLLHTFERIREVLGADDNHGCTGVGGSVAY